MIRMSAEACGSPARQVPDFWSRAAVRLALETSVTLLDASYLRREWGTNVLYRDFVPLQTGSFIISKWLNHCQDYDRHQQYRRNFVPYPVKGSGMLIAVSSKYLNPARIEPVDPAHCQH